jgi:Helix-turn-helix.
MDFRDRINAIIDSDDELSVRNVSLKAGLSDSALNKLLKGDVRSPTLETIEKLADALDVDARWLAFGEGQPERFSDVGNLLQAMSEERRKQALEFLQVFARTGTGG